MVPATPDVTWIRWEHIPAPVSWHCCTVCSTITYRPDHCLSDQYMLGRHMLDHLLEGRTQMSVQDDTQARLSRAVAEEASA